MNYLLFCLRSGNVITDFASERDAWDALLSWARDDGLDALAGLSLMRIQDGDPTRIAMEDELVRRVADELGEAEDRASGNRSAPVGRTAP